MKNFYIITLLFLALYSCKDAKTEVKTDRKEAQVETVSGATIFSSYDRVHEMIQGSWSNTLDPNSTVIFEEKTSTNKYQDVIAKKDVPYNISTNCSNEASTKSAENFRYINTNGAYAECYYIETLDEKTLVMRFDKGDITLTFSRINIAL